MKLRGFTLIELVVTVAIIAILASGILPVAKLVAQREKEKELRASLRNMREAIDSYKKAFDDKRIRKSPGAIWLSAEPGHASGRCTRRERSGEAQATFPAQDSG